MEKSPDETLREEVQNRLMNNPATSESAIEVAVLNGQVTLRGVVDSPDVKEIAESEARGVPGITTVVAEIEVHQDEDNVERVDPNTGVHPPIIPKTNQ